MKKLIQIFALGFILTTGYAAMAGTNKGMTTPNLPEKEVSSIRTSFVKSNRLGGEMILTVVVLDITSHPIQGATVSAPCTGMSNKLTDVHGKAVFDMGTVCGCNSDPVTVTTTHGCYQQFKASCDTYNVTCNQ